MSAQGGSPEMLALIVQASAETVRIPLSSRSIATQMRHRIHSFRKRLRKEGENPLATPAQEANAAIAEQVETSILEEEGMIFLIVRPRDSEFIAALKAAGIGEGRDITPAAAPPSSLSETTSIPLASPPSSPLDDYLNPVKDENKT